MGWEEVDEAISICSQCGDNAVTVRLSITPCGHTLCDVCKGSEFKGRKTSLDCRGCAQEGTASSFKADELVPTAALWTQQRKDPAVKQELPHRHRVLKLYSRSEADFPDARAYNQWLDKVETMIQSLASKTNVDAIEEELAVYEKSERDAIINHQAARSRALDAYGAQPLPWQRAPPRRGLHWKEPAKNAPNAVTADECDWRLMNSHDPTQKLNSLVHSRQGERPPQPAGPVSPPCELVPKAEVQPKNPVLAQAAAGFTPDDEGRRNCEAGLSALRAALRRRIG